MSAKKRMLILILLFPKKANANEIGNVEGLLPVTCVTSKETI